jgi:hypothetical protein
MNLALSKKWLTSFCFAGALLNAEIASALTITIDPATTAALLTGNQTGISEINTFITNTLGVAPTLLYKKDVIGGAESGALAGSYSTTFYNSPTDPSDALIDYVGGTAVGSIALLLVKDGANSPAWYLYNLTSLGWNGTDDVVLDNFWPGTGAISCVTLYQTSSVPDGGATVALLGFALAGIATVRRFQNKK